MVNALQMGIIGGGIGAVVFVIFAFFIIERPEPSQMILQDVKFSIKDLRLTNTSINETSVTITFSFINPNANTIILEVVNYKLFANDIMVAASGVGERVEGAIGSTGGTYYLVPQTNVDIQDNVLIKRIPSLEKIWDDIQNNKVSWKVTGSYVIIYPREGGKEYNFTQYL